MTLSKAALQRSPYKDIANTNTRSVGRPALDTVWRTKMKRIFDRDFRYTSSAETDLRKTFARVRRDISRVEQAQSSANADVLRKVLPIAARRAVPARP